MRKIAMRMSAALAGSALLLSACGAPDGAAPPSEAPAAGGEAPAPAPQAASGQPPPQAGGWNLETNGQGALLTLHNAAASPALRLFCPAGRGELLVNIPSFRPVGSEERLSFGSGGDAAALVGDGRGDQQRGGVTGTGAVPGNLAALIAGRCRPAMVPRPAGRTRRPRPASPDPSSRLATKASPPRPRPAPPPARPARA
jgi:hypothetical protein